MQIKSKPLDFKVEWISFTNIFQQRSIFRLPFALTMLIALSLTIFAFVLTKDGESERQRLEFRKQAALLHQTLESKIQLNLDAIHALRDYHYGVEKLTFKGFTAFTKELLLRHPSINGVSFNPRISAEARADFELSIRREISPKFSIKERDPEGNIQNASRRSDYVTVAYIQPFDKNQKAFGFDVASNPVRKAALELARDTGSAVVTKRITLVQEKGKQAGVLAFVPVYSAKRTPITEEDRRKYLHGYMVGVFRVGDLLASALTGVSPKNISARLYEAEDSVFLAGYGGGKGLWDAEAEIVTNTVWWSQEFDFGGQKWRLELSPTKTILKNQSSSGAWLVLAGGLLFTSLLGIFLLFMTGYATRVEEEVIERTAKIKSVEGEVRKLSLAMEQSPNLTIITNTDGRIEYVNPAFESATGYMKEEVLGKNPRILRSGHTSKEEYEGLWQTIKVGSIWRGEMKNRRKDGSFYWALISISPVRDESEVITHFVSVQEDITKRKEAEKAILKAKEAAEAASQAKSEFLSNVSHELRTPLTSMNAAVKLLKDGTIPGVPEDAQEMIELIDRNGERLLSLINDILDFSKIEADKMELSLTSKNATEIIQQVVESMQGLAAEKGLELNYAVTSDLKILTDTQRIEQVLINLIGNAIKFTDAGNISVSVRESDGFAEFSVADTGCGIPSKQKESIFDSFAQADGSSTRKAGGTGLGLAISQRFIHLHGGKIWVNSEEGMGSTFYFTVPLTETKEK